MKVLIINVVCGIMSTGKICTDLASSFEHNGAEVRIGYGRGSIPKEWQTKSIRIGNNLSTYVNALNARIFDNDGFSAKLATKKFLKWATKYNPDLLWMHNLHGYYINVPLLFQWIKTRPNMEVKWTLHDCWAFTGHCTYFSFVNCKKWTSGCYNCPQKMSYPKSILFDKSYEHYELKRKIFTNVSKLKIITPSVWLKKLVEKSFLSSYSVEVINNDIDKSVFKYVDNDFKKKHNITDKCMILGVASVWKKRKGLDDFLKLYTLLNKNEFSIVLVGVNRKQKKRLPSDIITIYKTNDKEELVGIYSAADFFVNPTYEDNYPTVNLEAQACGTYTITYASGGSAETIEDFKGCAVRTGDVNAIYRIIIEKSKEQKNI